MTTDLDRSTLSGTYTIDPAHSRFGFVARHAMVTKVRGAFNDFTGTLTVDAETPERSSADITIQATSVDTRNADRDAHLRSNDFFDMDTYPELTFTATKVEPVGGEHFKVTGDLTVRGVTKPVTLELAYTGAVVDPWGFTRIGFDGQAEVNRKDWGLTWNAALEAGGILVSEHVTIEVELSATKNEEA